MLRLRQPGLIEQLAAVVTQRASCVIELEGGAPLTIRQPDAAAHIPATHKAPALLSQYHPLHFPLDHARDSTTVVVTPSLSGE